MQVIIDKNAGFCWGVVRAIEMAEKELNASGKLYSLGEIIHNPVEVERLREKGLTTISHEELKNAKGAKVLIRAHGEPPSTYEIAKKYGVEIIDATCPVVTKLQSRVRKFYLDGYRVVIFGKKDHPEVIGLVGQCDGNAIVIKSLEEIDKVPLTGKVVLFSQTTMSKDLFYKIKEELEKRVEALIKDNPNDLDALNLLAIAYRLKGDFNEAMRILKRSLKIDPNYPETRYHLGLLYYEQGDYLKAIGEFYKAIENYLPSERSWKSDAYTALGETFYKLGMIDDAIKSWKTALEIYPRNKRAKYYLNKVKAGKIKRVKKPILVFDFLRFSDMKIDEYLKQKGKNKFDSEREYKHVLNKIINAWNTNVSKVSDKLKRMTDKEKLNYFRSIKIKF